MPLTPESAKERLEKVKSDRESRKKSHSHKSSSSSSSSSSRKRHSSSSEERKKKEQDALLELDPELCSILSQLSIQHYAPIFLSNNVKTGTQFRDLSDRQLKAMGISSRSRVKILEYLLENTRSEVARMSLSLSSVAAEPTPTPTPTAHAPEQQAVSSENDTKNDKLFAHATQELFAQFDTDKSGSISLSELQDALAEGGFEFDENQISLLLLSVDADLNGNLNFSEFADLVEQLNLLENTFECEILTFNKVFDRLVLKAITKDLGLNFNEVQLRTVYEFADADKSGTIDREEFITLGLFLRLCRALFRRADLDKSGSLDFNEVFKILPVILPNSVSTEKFIVRSIFNNIDSDKDNALTLEEFVHLIATVKMD